MAIKSHAGNEIVQGSPLLVGVINLSPESFYSGSVADNVSGIEQKIDEFHQYGVDCLDVGAMSTRPLDIYGGRQATINEEVSRLKDLLPKLMDVANSYNLPVALDTQYAKSAKIGLDLGVEVINDISGFQTDQAMLDVISEYSVEVVIMATDKKPGDVCGITPTMEALENSIQLAEEKGIDRSKIVIDPGFGGWQGRDSSCDIDLLKNFEELKQFDLPIYVGVSRKSTIGTLNGGEKAKDRLPGSLILTQWLVEKGADIIRTHDVKETRLALNVYQELQNFS